MIFSCLEIYYFEYLYVFIHIDVYLYFIKLIQESMWVCVVAKVSFYNINKIY